MAASPMISSIIRFVDPYGFVVLTGKSSRIGRDFGFPYTVALELNTSFFTPLFSIASSRFIEEKRLFS